MPNYAKGLKALSEVLRKNAKNLADSKANPKSFYAKLPIEHQQAYIDDVLRGMERNNPSKSFDEAEFLSQLRNRMATEQQASKAQKAFEASQPVKEPDLHTRNFDLEHQADEFLKQHDPAFFEELENAMKGYDENIENIADYSHMPTIERELETIVPQKDLNYHLSKDPISEQKLNFPETSLNSHYHNVKMPKGEFYFEGSHKPADYYHNILWNYINKGSNRDAMLDEFFQDILHKPTPTNQSEKFNTIKRYKDALDKRRLELDMKNKPYNKHKLNNMQTIEDYFESQRPYSFEDFESSTLSEGPRSIQNYLDVLNNR